MKKSDIEKRIRHLETANDYTVLPGIPMVARIDGRNFSRLTKELHDFERPFDARLHEMMLQTTEHLMECGFQIIYAYTQSDEISLLFAPEESTFSRKTRKYLSVLAGEASAKFSVQLGSVAVFDCRIIELPRVEDVLDYFEWRQSDAHRNALNAHAYWKLRGEGATERDATETLKGATVAQKNELLFQRGLNFNDLPSWQKRGVGLYWEEFEKVSIDPRNQQEVAAIRRRIRQDLELPLGADYRTLVKSIWDKSEK